MSVVTRIITQATLPKLKHGSVMVEIAWLVSCGGIKSVASDTDVLATQDNVSFIFFTVCYVRTLCFLVYMIVEVK